MILVEVKMLMLAVIGMDKAACLIAIEHVGLTGRGEKTMEGTNERY
jgi:hypothetical protein